MSQTLDVYDRMAGDYAAMQVGYEQPGLEDFVFAMPKGARVLDLGCGPGLHAARMVDAGLNVLAVDGSAEMVALAQTSGAEVRQATFDDIPTLGKFDGLWISFCLLHAPRADLPRHLGALHSVSNRGARLALGMKLGKGEGTDRLGRFYTYYSEAELRDHLAEAGFTMQSSLHGRDKGLSGETSDWILITAHA